MNIIIPLGGLGQRFKDDGYTKPKPLINIFGKEMIFHLIDNLFPQENDNIFLIYNKELNKYSFNTILKDKYKKIHLIELNKQTEGAAETILYGLNQIEPNLLKNKCVLLDCDTFYHINILDIYRNQNNNAVFCFKDNQDKPIFSYLKINNNIIEDIKEKIKISEYANTGCYCFEKGFLLKKYCENIIEKNIREKGEFYTSCVIKEMLLDNHIFHPNIINLKDFSCVGTPLQLKIYCSSFKNNYNKRFCFDIYKTLLSYPEIYDDYTTIKPNIKNIDYLKYLKNLGHTIILYTSIGMKRYEGNIGLIYKNISKYTFDNLEKYNIPFDEIYFGKPYADFYIDELGVNSCEDLEKQLGFYKIDVKERYFNEIKTENMEIIIKKSECNSDKIKGEIFYYKNIPPSIRKYFPIFINHTENSYSIEKINGITLSYLFVNESLSEDIFLKYLLLLKEIHSLNTDDNIENENIPIYDNYSKKLEERYKNYNYSKFIDSNLVYTELLKYLFDYEKNKYGKIGIIHGDSVFSNCLIDQNNSFKLIDMRGKLNNETYTIYGDIFYDYAKIYQSLIGYDEILFDKIVSNDYKKKLMYIFENFIESNYSKEYIFKIKMLTKSLLFTLIPLHNNDKCEYFYNLISIN